MLITNKLAAFYTKSKHLNKVDKAKNSNLSIKDSQKIYLLSMQRAHNLNLKKKKKKKTHQS